MNWKIILRASEGVATIFALPVTIAILLFNTSNLYMIIPVNKIPIWIYVIACVITIVEGYYAVKKIRKLIHTHSND